MKRTFAKRLCLALSVLVLACGCVVFAACNDEDARGEEAVISVIIGDGEAASVTTDAKYLYGALKDLCEKEGIPLEGEDGAYGFYLTRIGDLVQGDGAYIMLYHDIDDVTLCTPGYNYEVGGKTFFSSSLGVSSLPVVDGATYLIVLI